MNDDINLNASDIREFFNQIQKKNPQIKTSALENTTITILQEQWKSIAGEILASHSLPISIKNNTLTVIADHNTFSQQILMLQNQLISKINSTSLTQIKFIRCFAGKISWPISLKSNKESPSNEVKIHDAMSENANLTSNNSRQSEISPEMRRLLTELKNTGR